MSCRACRSARAQEAASTLPARAKAARRSLSITPIRPTRWPRRSMPCGLMCESRLLVVFGCGGDRDKGKRPQMGAVAVARADLAIVTDDNPRSEDPAADPPRDPGGGARRRSRSATARKPSREAVAMLRRGDVLLVAGKGHETGQTVGDDRHSIFRPRRGVRRAGQRGETWLIRSGPSGRSWPPRAASASGEAGAPVGRFSIDSRSLEPGEGFIAIRGPNRDGHGLCRSRHSRRVRPVPWSTSAFPSSDEERLVRVDRHLRRAE